MTLKESWAWLLSWVFYLARRCLGCLLLLGQRPRHIAFIMDGNRRFADHRHIDKISGHKRGYGKMIDVIHWCLELGVPCVSVYAFSIDNFQRSPTEVESLMNLAEEKYAELAKEDGLAEKERIRIQVLGDLSLAPDSVQGAAARMMQTTAKLRNSKAVLNICFSYTATEEIVHAVDLIQEAIKEGRLEPSDITPGLVDSCLRTTTCPPVDLVLRTSGETRLSDFLLWQSRSAQLYFIDRLWPDFSFLDFARCILNFQRSAVDHERLRCMCRDVQSDFKPKKTWSSILDLMTAWALNWLQVFGFSNNQVFEVDGDGQRVRTETFLQHLWDKNTAWVESHVQKVQFPVVSS